MSREEIHFECFCGNKGNVVFKKETTTRRMVFALNKLHRQLSCDECPYKFNPPFEYQENKDNQKPLTETS